MDSIPLAGLAGLALLSACSNSTGFQTGNSGGNEAEGTPKMEYTPQSLEFADLALGISNSELFKVTSTGDNDLKLYTVDISNSGDGVFYMAGEDGIELQPGATREFTVVATMEEEGTVDGEVRITSNDSDYLDLRIPVTAWSATAGDGGGSDGGGSDGGGSDGGGSDGGGSDGGAGDGGSGDGGSTR